MHDSAISKGKANYQVRFGDSTSTHIDQTQDESGKGESAQAQWRGIGEFAILDGPVQAGLEFSTKGRKTSRGGAVDVSERAIAKLGGGDGGLVFFVSHLAAHAIHAVGAIGAVVGAIW